MKSERGELILDSPEILKDYAVNGAVHYARHIIKHTNIVEKVLRLAHQVMGIRIKLAYIM